MSQQAHNSTLPESQFRTVPDLFGVTICKPGNRMHISYDELPALIDQLQLQMRRDPAAACDSAPLRGDRQRVVGE